MADPIIGIKITGDGKDLETALNRAAKEVREFGDGVAKAKAPVSDLAVQTKAAFDATGVRDFGREVTKAQEPVTTLSQSLRAFTVFSTDLSRRPSSCQSLSASTASRNPLGTRTELLEFCPLTVTYASPSKCAS